MQRYTGTEPVTARSALRLRMLLSSIFLPVFLAGAALFWYWKSQAGPGDTPGPGPLQGLAVICSVLAVLAVVDLFVVRFRMRQAERGRKQGAEPRRPRQ